MSEFEAQDFSGTEPIKAEREGLPPGYRMRADAHYVELLSSGRERGRGENRGATREQDTSIALAARAQSDRRVFDHLLEEVAAIESAAAMLAGDSSPLSRRVSLDLIRAQAARASWLIRAQALLAGTAPELSPKSRPIGVVLGQMRERLVAECRLAGVSLHVATEANMPVMVDEAALGLGVTGAVMSLLPLLAGAEGAVIRLEAAIEEEDEDDDLQAIEITQDIAPLSSTARQRFFDADWADRPGGWLAAAGAAVAFATAERFGGRATLTAGARRGCSIRLSFE